MAMVIIPISKTLKHYYQKHENKESIDKLSSSIPISKLVHALYLEVTTTP
jgi:hypothetical protein